MPNIDKTINILLVEDEAIVAILMLKELANIGYHVLGHGKTGEKAITSADQNPPDLILMDTNLAGEIDGIVSS